VKSGVLVIGDFIIDEYILGNVTRLCQEAPVPILNKGETMICPGGAGNVSLNVAKAQVPVRLLSIVENDECVKIAIESLSNAEVDTSLIVFESKQRVCKKTRFVSCDYVLLRVDDDHMIKYNSGNEMKILNLLEENIRWCKLIILSDYSKGMITKKLAREIITIANKFNVKVLVDVKGHDTKKYVGAYLLKPNLKELGELTNMPIGTHEEIYNAALSLCKSCSCECVLTTLSERGMLFVNAEGMQYFVEGVRYSNPQVIGAGDTVIAYVAIGLFHNLPIKETIDLAYAAANVAVTKSGTVGVSYEEVIKFSLGNC
jgi:D-beta-D-heptose 7-phosphate kinase/D-beta-D-heptose 1-phosphate adenosyltransferase